MNSNSQTSLNAQQIGSNGTKVAHEGIRVLFFGGPQHDPVAWPPADLFDLSQDLEDSRELAEPDLVRHVA